jgi:hypothetical protein
MESVNITEPAVLLCINRLYRPGMSGIDLYDATRGVWAARSDRRSRARLAFAVLHGRVVGVYQIQQWHRAGTTPYASGRQIDLAAHRMDWEFSGVPANSEIANKYVGQTAPRFWGNPVRYLNT